MPKIKTALTAAAICRGAKLDAATITLYSTRLAKDALQDVLFALDRLSEMPRGEYESALPDLGALLALVETCRISRQNRAEMEHNKRLFYFNCDHCGHNESGHYAPSDPRVCEVRICKSIYGPIGSKQILTHGTICGHEMRVEMFESIEDAQRRVKREAEVSA